MHDLGKEPMLAESEGLYCTTETRWCRASVPDQGQRECLAWPWPAMFPRSEAVSLRCSLKREWLLAARFVAGPDLKQLEALR